MELKGILEMENAGYIVADNSSNIHNTNCSLNPFNYTCGIRHPNRSFIPLPLIITLMGLIHIVGFFGNSVVVFIVVSKRRKQSYTNWMILNLAVSDLAVVLFCIPLDIPLFIKRKWIYGKFFCSIYYPIGTTPLLSSVFTLVSIAFARYWGIANPFGKQASGFVAKVVIAVIWAVSFLLISPLIIIFRYNSKYEVCYEHWKPSSRRIYTIIIFLLGYALPLAVITFAYTFIMYEVSIKEKSSQLPYRDACRRKENNVLIKLALIVTVTFAVCVLPNQLVYLFYEFGNLSQYKYNADVRNVSNLLLFLNSALNPLIYNVFNETFRDGFKQLFASGFAYFGKRRSALNRSFTLRSMVDHERIVRDDTDYVETTSSFLSTK